MIKIGPTTRIDPEAIKGYHFESPEDYDGVSEPKIVITFYDTTLDAYLGQDAILIFEALDKHFFPKGKKK